LEPDLRRGDPRIAHALTLARTCQITEEERRKAAQLGVKEKPSFLKAAMKFNGLAWTEARRRRAGEAAHCSQDGHQEEEMSEHPWESRQDLKEGVPKRERENGGQPV